MKKGLKVFVFLAILSLSCSGAVFCDEPTLNETVSFIMKKANGRYSCGGKCVCHQKISFDGCGMTVYKYTDNGIGTKWEDRFLINAKNISRVRHLVNFHSWTKAYVSDSLEMEVAGEKEPIDIDFLGGDEMFRRLSKALNHYIKLCTGKGLYPEGYFDKKREPF